MAEFEGVLAGATFVKRFVHAVGTRITRTFRNIMIGTSSGLAGLFDYSYVVGDGRTSRTCAQTVASFAKTGVLMPVFEPLALPTIVRTG